MTTPNTSCAARKAWPEVPAALTSAPFCRWETTCCPQRCAWSGRPFPICDRASPAVACTHRCGMLVPHHPMLVLVS